MPRPRHSGQASVELVALLPLLALGAAALCQLALAGHAAWAAAGAARAAARAHAVGLDPRDAARAALPNHLEHRLAFRALSDGAITLTVHVPTLLPALDLGSITTRSRFEPQ